ncbi:unnamed protein product [Spirodela intermedia]|uniref:Uncharacterized protein n=1 Tax=Spirodela intermedia TaxID=51605 RepID=A0A7I8JRM5_SPIIN|nr:unnamed protein product [Spirodela intermedia]CAA6672828.1 unnamed protein product [Spirodela intermedia]
MSRPSTMSSSRWLSFRRLPPCGRRRRCTNPLKKDEPFIVIKLFDCEAMLIVNPKTGQQPKLSFNVVGVHRWVQYTIMNYSIKGFEFYDLVCYHTKK